MGREEWEKVMKGEYYLLCSSCTTLTTVVISKYSALRVEHSGLRAPVFRMSIRRLKA
jgi:hypothetical protein